MVTSAVADLAAPPGSLAADLAAIENWSGVDPGAHLLAAQDVETRAGQRGLVADAMRARLVRAEMLGRTGRIVDGSRLAAEVGSWARRHGELLMCARSHRALSRSAHHAGDPAGCLDHAVQAVELLDESASPIVRANHLMTLADALGWNGMTGQAFERYGDAERLYLGAGDIVRLLHLLNNLAYAQYESGHGDLAAATGERLLTLAATYRLPLQLSFLDTVARTRMAVGRYAEAAELLVDALNRDGGGGPDMADTQDADELLTVLVTLAQSQRHLGSLEAAQQTLDRARELIEPGELAGIAIEIEVEQAELHAAAGRHRQAYDLLKSSVRAAEDERSRRRDEQAQTRHALLRTTEARADAERFRRQANTDPLTGLANRRFVDSTLPVLLHRAVRDGTELVVGIIDIDHFKSINDAFSHEVGDRVLVVIGSLLSAAIADSVGPEPGSWLPPTADPAMADGRPFVARLGGEEFLLALPVASGASGAEVACRLDALRLAIRDHDWSPLTGERTVTVSIGAARARTDSTQSGILAEADRCLYEAKNAGRDRVVV